MGKSNGFTGGRQLPLPSKIGDTKLYDYIKKIEVDGLPRLRAYAEAIDPKIYELTPTQQSDVLDNLKRRSKVYDDIRDMVLAEQEDWILRKSATIQNKAVELLANLINKANEIATNPDADAKDLNTAVSTLKAIMPAFNNQGAKTHDSDGAVDRKMRAERFIK